MSAVEQPVDRLLAELRRAHPTARIERLRVKYPADDDNVWFVQDGGQEVQFDCQPDGSGPLIVEADDGQRVRAPDVESALSEVGRMLRGEGRVLVAAPLSYMSSQTPYAC